MKTFVRVVVCVVALCAGVRAQSVVGVWQGTVAELPYPRTTLKIVKNDDGSLRGVMFRYDASADGIPLTELSFKAPEFHAGIGWVDADFQGTLSADGKSIKGTWTQNKHAYPLTFALATPETMWSYARTTAVAAMAATANPSFDVATIKPTAPDSKQHGDIRTRHFSLTRYSVEDLITFAYRVGPDQIDSSGLKAEWVSADKFDVAGEPDKEGMPSQEQFRVMVQKLLADRFQLKLHTVQRPFAVFALVVDKASGKVQPTDKSVNSFSRIFTRKLEDGQLAAQFSNMGMEEFTHVLMSFIKDRHIVDETGLKGEYDFTLTLPMSVLQGGDPNDDPANDFTRAVQQVGFKLVPKKTDLTVYVVDSVEHPSAN